MGSRRSPYTVAYCWPSKWIWTKDSQRQSAARQTVLGIQLLTNYTHARTLFFTVRAELPRHSLSSTPQTHTQKHSQYRQERQTSGQLYAPVTLPSTEEPSVNTERRLGGSHGRTWRFHTAKEFCTSLQITVTNSHIAKRLSLDKTPMTHTSPYCWHSTWSVSISVGGFVTRLAGLVSTALLYVMAGLLRRSAGALGTAGNLLMAHSFTPRQVPRGHLNNSQCCILWSRKPYSKLWRDLRVSVLCLSWLIMAVQTAKENRQR